MYCVVMRFIALRICLSVVVFTATQALAEERPSLNPNPRSAEFPITIVMLHGTPGSANAFNKYLGDERLTQKANLVALNRPGFGENDFGELAVGLQAQSTALMSALESAAAEGKVIVLGHSLGGSIAAQLAVDAPEFVDGIVLVAATIDPAYGAPRWFNRLGNLRLIRWMLPKDMRMANDEIMPLQKDLQRLAPRLAKVDMPVTFIQGMDDYLVSPKNAESAKALFLNAELKVVPFAQEGHFILWQNQSAIVDELLSMIARLQGSKN
jgi:pimeloyl-ACP methyl ester carboxylesterase